MTGLAQILLFGVTGSNVTLLEDSRGCARRIPGIGNAVTVEYVANGKTLNIVGIEIDIQSSFYVYGLSADKGSVPQVGADDNAN